jgi:oligopeptide/dipeptide ABC transporter ATP-binding protein
MEIIKTEGLTKHFTIRSGIFRKGQILTALEDVNISIQERTVFAVVGESGSGKSTLARVILRLIKPTGGRVFFRDKDVFSLKGDELKNYRRSVQIIFQDPFASLNPRMSIYSIIAEPLKIHGLVSKDRLKNRVVELLELVGLKEEHMYRYPHQFSGGQRQRISIARALALSPELIIADEPLSSLDVSIQAQILNLMNELKEKKNLTYLFISHDLNVVNYFADRVAVMYLGRIVEEAVAEELFKHPLHPYTELLIDSIPKLRSDIDLRSRRDETKEKIKIISTTQVERGCLFRNRCPLAKGICERHEPELKEQADRKIACHLY